MANEVVNPWQTFRDVKGRPLSGGKLRIRQPGTSALGTAFSDSALTIPQAVDPYPLDDYGRVTGDLRWAGTRDVEVYDRFDAFVRKNPDVVTLIDSSVFAINAPSVAAMVANVALVLGDVVETQSYNAGQNEGGARYIIVAGGTGVDDGYIFHTLANALQAQLLDQESNKNFYVAGAIGDGVANDTVPVQRLLTIGGDIECANGIFEVAGLTCAVNARIYGNGTLERFAFSNADLITLTGIDNLVTFDGVVLDGNVANQSAEQTIAIVRSALTASSAITLSMVTFNNVLFQNGSQNDVAAIGDDTGFPVVYNFAQCDFLGGEQGQADGTFDVASLLMQDGVSCSVEDCYWDLQVAPTVGRAAIVSGGSAGALTNPGWLSVDASTLVLMGLEATALADSRGAIHARDVINLIVNANRILTPTAGGIVFGAEVDTATITDNTVSALATAAVAWGGIAAIVTTNAAPGDNWQISGNQIPNCGAVAINLDGASAGLDASNVQVHDNNIVGPTLQAILYHNLNGLSIKDNFIDMEDIAAVNAIEANTDGVAGNISVEGNELVNLAASIALVDIVSTAANYVVDGNTVDGALDGFTLDGMADAFITNNVLNELTGDLITVGNLDNCRIDGNSYVGVAVPTTFPQNSGSITSLVIGENFFTQLDNSITQIPVTGANISAGPIVAHFQVFVPTGATSIDTLTDPAIDGYMVVLQGTGAATVTLNDGLGNINLGAATRVLTDATDTLTLVWNQTNSEWNEVAFSNN